MTREKLSHSEIKIVPLTEDDIYVLKTIYGSRIRIFLFVYPAIFFLTIFYAYPRLLRFYHGTDDDILSLFGTIAGILLVLVIPFCILFYKRIWLYRLDLKAGMKIEIQEQIINKLYFRNTDQYFVSLADTNYMHHEVDAETYNSINIGDSIPIYFAANSGYAFNIRSSFVVM